MCIMPIIRGRFNPAELIGKGWGVVESETDKRSAALNKLDLANVHKIARLRSCVKEEERFKHPRGGKIRLDAEVLITFWEHQYFIPESWKEKVCGDICRIFFEGTILQNSSGERSVLYLYWNLNEWKWSIIRLENSLIRGSFLL